MRHLTTSAIILVLALSALPVAAGDDKPKCEGELTACAEQMAAKVSQPRLGRDQPRLR